MTTNPEQSTSSEKQEGQETKEKVDHLKITIEGMSDAEKQELPKYLKKNLTENGLFGFLGKIFKELGLSDNGTLGQFLKRLENVVDKQDSLAKNAQMLDIVNHQPHLFPKGTATLLKNLKEDSDLQEAMLEKKYEGLKNDEQLKIIWNILNPTANEDDFEAGDFRKTLEKQINPEQVGPDIVVPSYHTILGRLNNLLYTNIRQLGIKEYTEAPERMITQHHPRYLERKAVMSTLNNIKDLKRTDLDTFVYGNDRAIPKNTNPDHFKNEDLDKTIPNTEYSLSDLLLELNQCIAQHPRETSGKTLTEQLNFMTQHSSLLPEDGNLKTVLEQGENSTILKSLQSVSPDAFATSVDKLKAMNYTVDAINQFTTFYVQNYDKITTDNSAKQALSILLTNYRNDLNTFLGNPPDITQTLFFKRLDQDTQQYLQTSLDVINNNGSDSESISNSYSGLTLTYLTPKKGEIVSTTSTDIPQTQKTVDSPSAPIDEFQKITQLLLSNLPNDPTSSGKDLYKFLKKPHPTTFDKADFSPAYSGESIELSNGTTITLSGLLTELMNFTQNTGEKKMEKSDEEAQGDKAMSALGKKLAKANRNINDLGDSYPNLQRWLEVNGKKKNESGYLVNRSFNELSTALSEQANLSSYQQDIQKTYQYQEAVSYTVEALLKTAAFDDAHQDSYPAKKVIQELQQKNYQHFCKLFSITPPIIDENRNDISTSTLLAHLKDAEKDKLKTIISSISTSSNSSGQ